MMNDFSSILNHITLSEEEKELFISVLRITKVKRKQPGYVSKYRTYVVDGALRAFFIDTDGHEHTISLAEKFLKFRNEEGNLNNAHNCGIILLWFRI
jgi:hypothetical protein